jgi:4-aminobutyrate aminotransferase/(S)-3-amino-2-methylpropionate transaminase
MPADMTISPDELSSCMNNQEPGSPKMSILSFTSAFHGRLFGSLSATRSKAIHKVGIPAFDCELARQARIPCLHSKMSIASC